MLKSLKQEDFEKYIDWAYNLALDRKRSAYPTYSDSVKTKEDFIKSAKAAFDTETEEILLFVSDGKVRGWIHYEALPEDKYIGLHSFNTEANQRQALKEFEAFCKERFKGFNLYMGFPEENTEAVSYFKANGYELLERSFPHVYHLDKFAKYDCSADIKRITKENYEEFEKLHKQIDGDMYWTSERILNDIENWQIFLYDDGTARGAIYFTGLNSLPEIFGVDFDENKFNPSVFCELVKKCLNSLSEIDAKHLYYFAEGECEAEILSRLGFNQIGIYNCFLKKL